MVDVAATIISASSGVEGILAVVADKLVVASAVVLVVLMVVVVVVVGLRLVRICVVVGVAVVDVT